MILAQRAIIRKSKVNWNAFVARRDFPPRKFADGTLINAKVIFLWPLSFLINFKTIIWIYKFCLEICPAGTYGTTVTENDLALEPCTSCPVGFYQPERGRNFCEICPRNYTTSKRGSIHSDSCIDASELRDPCYKFNCQNGGQCFLNDNFAYCKCLPGYAGNDFSNGRIMAGVAEKLIFLTFLRFSRR